jgi:RND family efflux transporter MFP subunit
MSTKRNIAVLATVITLGVAGWFGWQHFGASPSVNDQAAGGERSAGASGPSGAAARGGGRPAGGGGRGGPRQSLVVVGAVTLATTGDRLSAIGDGEAVASVEVVPRDNGVVIAVPVQSGQGVSAGDVLVQLDREAETIARDIAARAVQDASTLRDRRARLKRSQAGSQSDLDEAEASLARATLALRDAALTLARRDVVAPIDGVVGLVPVEPGDRVTPNTVLATIDDRSHIRVDFRIPERFASRVTVDQAIAATSYALPGTELNGKVVAIGSRVEIDSRSLPVQAVIDNAEDRLRPGMSFQVTLRFAGEELPAVDPLAVQWDSRGAFVWRVDDGSVTRVSVGIVQREPEMVLVNAALEEGDLVVTEGVLSLRPGASVRIDNPPQGQSSERPSDQSSARPSDNSSETSKGSESS